LITFFSKIFIHQFDIIYKSVTISLITSAKTNVGYGACSHTEHRTLAQQHRP